MNLHKPALAVFLSLSTAFVTTAVADKPKDLISPPAGNLLATDPNAGKLIEIEAYWVRLNTKQIEALEHSPMTSMEILTEPNVLFCRAHTAGFENQTVAVTTKLTENVIKGATPIVAPGVLAYDVATEPQDTGVDLEVTPSLSDDQTVSIEVKSEVTTVIRNGAIQTPAGKTSAPTTEPAEPLPPDQALTKAAKAVIAPIKSQQEIKTSVRLHPGVPMIVGGMTDQPGNADPRTLCLVLVAKVDSDHPAGGK
jgi:Flp pilus assembly secretin CpaC